MSAFAGRATRRGRKLALAVGFLALSIALALAYANPADGYEVSIYTATPIGFWVGVAVALLVAIPIVIYSSRGYVNFAGGVLAAGSVISIAALPIVRNYYYYGQADSLTHLGWAKDVTTGVLSPFNLFYPGIHTDGVFLQEVLGITVRRALLLTVLLVLVAFLIFVPLCVRSMTSHRGAVVIAGLSGLLLLPINQIGTHYMSAHPITDAIFLTPVVLYLLINYLTSTTDGYDSRYPVTATGILLAIALAGTVLYHPQQASNLIILFLVFSAVQFLYRVSSRDHRITEHRTLYGQTLVLIGSFMVWSLGRGRYERSVSLILEQAFSFLRGSAGAGGSVQSRGDSLAAVGSGLPELFTKLFGVSAVFALLTGLLVLTSLSGRLDDAPDTDALVKYFSVGLFVLVPYSLVFFVGSISKLFFRNVGLIMVFGTILGSIAFYRYITGLSTVVSTRSVRALTTVVIVLLLVFSLIVVFPSPYMFQPNQQTTSGEMAGYRSAFAHQADGVEVYGIRSGPWRIKHGLYGVTGRDTVKNGQRSISRTNLTKEFPEDRYLAVSSADTAREFEVYNQLRYDKANYTAFRNRQDVALVQSSDSFKLYLISGNDTAAGVSADRVRRDQPTRRSRSGDHRYRRSDRPFRSAYGAVRSPGS